MGVRRSGGAGAVLTAAWESCGSELTAAWDSCGIEVTAAWDRVEQSFDCSVGFTSVRTAARDPVVSDGGVG